MLALAVPFLFLHIKYQPGVRVRLGSTHLGIEASDLAVVVVALVALREGLRAGFAPLRPALPLWIASAALVVWILVRSESLVHLVTAVKFSEYALLAISAPLILRRRDDWELVAAAIVAWSVAATLFALLQFFGLDIADAWAAGRRQPSFLGHSDFAALSALALGIGFAAVLLASRRIGWLAVVTGALGLILSGASAGLIGIAAGTVALLYAIRRRRPLVLRDFAVSGIVVAVVAAGVLVLRGGDFESFLRFLHVKGKEAQTTQYRDLLAPHVARVHRLPNLARPSGRRRGLGGIHRSETSSTHSCRPPTRGSRTWPPSPFRRARTNGAFRTRTSRPQPTSG